MYACVVKNDDETWDIFSFLSYPANQEKQDRLEAAVASGLPITGLDLTEYGTQVRSGAVYDGTEFTGGDNRSIPEGSNLNLYSYVCNDTIILICLGQPNTELNDQMAAIFQSETTLIKVPEGQTAKVGDIWDGTNIISI
jgi:hypothetical protein